MRRCEFHLGGDLRTHRQEQRQQTEPRHFGGHALQIPVQNQIAIGAAHPPIDVHKQECEVVENIDPGKVWIEIDTIEERRSALPATYIPEMQIAMAMPDRPCRSAPVEQPAGPIQHVQTPLPQNRNPIRIAGRFRSDRVQVSLLNAIDCRRFFRIFDW